MTYSPALDEIAASWSLWQEYADPEGVYTRREFDALPLDEKLAMLRAAFPERPIKDAADDDESDLADAPGYASQVWSGWVWIVGSDELRYSKRATRGECIAAVREAYRRCGMDAFNPEA